MYVCLLCHIVFFHFGFVHGWVSLWKHLPHGSELSSGHQKSIINADISLTVGLRAMTHENLPIKRMYSVNVFLTAPAGLIDVTGSSVLPYWNGLGCVFLVLQRLLKFFSASESKKRKQHFDFGPQQYKYLTLPPCLPPDREAQGTGTSWWRNVWRTVHVRPSVMEFHH